MNSDTLHIGSNLRFNDNLPHVRILSLILSIPIHSIALRHKQYNSIILSFIPQNNDISLNSQ